MKWHEIPISCPRCGTDMAWTAFTVIAPHVVEYACDECEWKGDYNHQAGQYDEFSPEDYVLCENTSLDEVLNGIIELGGDVISESDGE